MEDKAEQALNEVPSTKNSMYKPTSLLELDDDCLITILRELATVKQFQMSRLHTRLRALVHGLWHLPQFNTLFLCDAVLRELSNDDFAQLMLAVNPFVQNIEAESLNMRRLRSLTSCRFENITSFYYEGIKDEEARLEEDLRPESCEIWNRSFQDEDILLLQRLLPNLSSFSLKACEISGKYICDFPKLGHLSLHTCQFLESENFRDIFQKLKLKTFDVMTDCDELNCCDLVEIKKCPSLRHIKVADYHLCFDEDIVTDLLMMPNLREVSIHSKNFIFDVIERVCKQSSKPIAGFQFIGALPDYATFFAKFAFMRMLRRLRLLEIPDADVSGTTMIHDHMLLELSKQLPDLQQLHLCGCLLESCKGLMHIIGNCRSLHHLDLSKTQSIDATFICQCLDLLKKQKWRTQPLILCLGGTEVNVKNIKESPHYIHNTRYLSIEESKWLRDLEPEDGVLTFSFDSL